MQSRYTISILILIFITLSIFYSSNIRNKDLNIIFADTEALREKGLSGMESLADNTIMFFTFERPGKYSFWMKDMKFPIDIIWLDENYNIIHMENNIYPNTFPKTFYSKTDSLYVIEGNIDFIEKNKLRIGITFNPTLYK